MEGDMHNQYEITKIINVFPLRVILHEKVHDKDINMKIIRSFKRYQNKIIILISSNEEKTLL